MVNIRHDDFGTLAPEGPDKLFFRNVDDFSGLPNGGIGVTTVDQMFDAILALKGAEIKAAYEGQTDTNAFTDAAAGVVTEALTDSDFVGANAGFLTKAGAGSYAVARVNSTATGAPGTGNDDTQGYEITSQWYDQVNDDLYVCFDATTGAAQWELINGGGGSLTEKGLEDLIETFSAATKPDTLDEFVYRDVSGTDTMGRATAQQIVEQGLDDLGIVPQIRKVDSVDPTTADKAPTYKHLDLWLNTFNDKVFTLVDETAGTWVDITQSGGGSATWGNISGTLSNQTDLQAALDAKLSLAGGTMTGTLDMGANNINTTGLVGGLDLSTVESGATADQTPAEIKTAYESNADTNAYDNAAVTTVAAALVDGDFGGTNPGLLARTGVGAYTSIRSNLVAARAPLATDDSGSSYSEGSLWIWKAQGRVWWCADATAGAAVWKEIEVTSLQKAYDNSSTPEITTSTLLGAFSLKRGSAADTDAVIEVQNGAGTQTFAVDGNGNVTTSGTVDGRDIATDGTKLDGIASGAEVNVIESVVEDTTPQLGGALDVNGNEITGAIDLHSTGDLILELGDAAGANAVSIRDSSGTEQAKIDSDGVFKSRQRIYHAPFPTGTSSDFAFVVLWNAPHALEITKLELVSPNRGINANASNYWSIDCLKNGTPADNLLSSRFTTASTTISAGVPVDLGTLVTDGAEDFVLNDTIQMDFDAVDAGSLTSWSQRDCYLRITCNEL